MTITILFDENQKLIYKNDSHFVQKVQIIIIEK